MSKRDDEKNEAIRLSTAKYMKEKYTIKSFCPQCATSNVRLTEAQQENAKLRARLERLEKVREAAVELEPWLPNIRCGVAAKFSEHIKASNCLRDALKNCEASDDKQD